MTVNADPHFGIPGKSWHKERNDWKLNSTHLRPGSPESVADVTQTLFILYFSIEKYILEYMK